VALAITVVGLAVYTFAGFAGGPIYLAPLVPLYTIATRGDRRHTLTAVLLTLGAFLVIGIVSDRREQHVVYMLAFGGWVGGAVFLGTTQHNRRAYLAQLEQRARDLEESRDEEARRRVAEERLRIARDLHDVIAHGIAAIHMQSGVALHVLDRQPQQAEPALIAVKQLSKQTLNELRATLDVLRADDGDAGPAPRAPTPGLAQLDSLVGATRQAGLPVELTVDGSAVPLPTATDVAAYRIVQESLTNVMRHAGPSAHARVTVVHRPGCVEIEVVDDGLGAASALGAPSGHGILGMSERAATVGGSVSARPNPGGGFRVSAHLPVDATTIAEPDGAPR
jgi:signal transduction histidine kinase